MSRTLPVNRFTTTAQGLVPAPVTSNGWALIDTGAWGVVPTSGLGTGTADASKFLRGDGTWSNTLTATAASTAFTVTGAATTAYVPSVLFTAPATSSQSNGLQIKAGTNINDAPFVVTTGLLGTPYNQLAMLGDGSWSFERSGPFATLACNSAGNFTIGAPSSGLALIVGAGGLLSGSTVSAQNTTWTTGFGVSSNVNGNASTAGGFKVSFGGNVGFDGANWRTATDGASNGGYLIGESYGGGGVSFYTVASTGGTSQTISNATMDTLKRFNLDAAGNYATHFYNSAGYGAGANGTAGVVLNNASTTMQTSVEFQKAGVISGRIRNDYGGNMSYVATGSGNHYFFTGGDSGPGLLAFGIAAGGALSVTLAATTTAPAAGGAGALPATPAGYAAITINGTARRIPYYT